MYVRYTLLGSPNTRVLVSTVETAHHRSLRTEVGLRLVKCLLFLTSCNCDSIRHFIVALVLDLTIVRHGTLGADALEAEERLGSLGNL